MKRRNFLVSLFVVPKALKRLAKPSPKGWFIANPHYASCNNFMQGNMVFHQRDFMGTCKFETITDT